MYQDICMKILQDPYSHQGILFQLVPIQELVYVPAAFDDRFCVSFPKKDNMNAGEMLFQHTGHGQGQDYVTEVVGTAENDLLHSSMAFTPGSSFPSMNSSIAPPPVDT